MKTTVKIRLAVWHTIFNLYLFATRYGVRDTWCHEVYANNDIVDTLGYDCDRTRFTSSYSDELVDVYRIHLLGLIIELSDEGGRNKHFSIYKNRI